jgi:hypothetical protein
MGDKMKLTIPPEPMIFTKQTKEHKSKRDWDFDSLTIWFGNKIPSYLWKEGGWSKPLKEEGYSWQSFLKILSLHKKEMIQWSRNAISWKDLLNIIKDTIKDPVLKKALVG